MRRLRDPKMTPETTSSPSRALEKRPWDGFRPSLRKAFSLFLKEQIFKLPKSLMSASDICPIVFRKILKRSQPGTKKEL